MQLSIFDIPIEDKNNEKLPENKADIKELINRRRNQILIHSCLYYRMNTSIIDDYTFDMWSKELAELQEQYPEIAKNCRWADAYKDFDGSSGFDLPLSHSWVVSKAQQLLEYHKKKEREKHEQN